MRAIDWTYVLPIANFVAVLVAYGGGYIIFRSTITRTALEVEKQVREALMIENDLLTKRVNRLEKNLKLIIELFAKENVTITIDGDVVEVKNNGRRYKA